jgi:hypothetical protein
MAENDGGGLGPVLNRALRAISEAVRDPWSVLRPGERVLPLMSSDAASQASTVPNSRAPTRQGTPAPEPRPGRRAGPPWTRAPSREGTPWSTPSDQASRAPTRPGTPAPEPRPPRRPTPQIPDTVPEGPELEPRPPQPQPEEPRPKRRRPRVPAPPDEDEPDLRRAPEAAGARARTTADKTALGLVRRARAWRAREGRPPSRVTPAAYDAVDAQGRFGLIECAGGDRPLPGAGETLLLAHTPPKRDPKSLLDLRPGDTVDVLSARPGAAGGGRLRVAFITRAGYFAPGRPVTSLALGVATAEWARALRGEPAPQGGPREPPAQGTRI